MEPTSLDVRWSKGHLILSGPYDLFTTISCVLNTRVLENNLTELDFSLDVICRHLLKLNGHSSNQLIPFLRHFHSLMFSVYHEYKWIPFFPCQKDHCVEVNKSLPLS